jgi:hypothetical protein
MLDVSDLRIDGVAYAFGWAPVSEQDTDEFLSRLLLDNNLVGIGAPMPCYARPGAQIAFVTYAQYRKRNRD